MVPSRPTANTTGVVFTGLTGEGDRVDPNQSVKIRQKFRLP